MGANLKKNLQILVIAAAVLLCAGLFFVFKNYGSPAALFDSWQFSGKGYVTKIVSAELLDGNKNFVADVAEKIKAKDNDWTSAEDGQFIKIVFERQLAAADDITIFARQKDLSSQPGKIEVYDGNGDLVETFFDIKQARSHKILLTKIFEATDTFYLKILGSPIELDYIFDPPEGGVTFSSGMKMNSGVGIGSQFSYRKRITISTTYIDADLVNFPLLVHLSADSDVGSHTQSTGNDIVFTASDGKTVLPYERESWSGGGGSAATANFWVRVPALDDAVDTDIYMYYGNSSAGDMSNAAAVWDTNFKGVWHLKETSGAHYDSTRNNNDSSTVSVTTQGSATGKVNGADSFNGTSNYVEMPGSSSLNITGTAITMSAWAYFTGEGTGNHFIVSKKFGDSLQFGLARYFSTNYYPHKVFMGFYTSSWGDRVISGTTLDDNTWYYITGTYDGTYASIYINGVIDNAYGVTGSITGNSADRTTIGCDAYATWNEFAEGTIDEVRISGSTRSAAWIKFEYHNMADSGNNLTFGSEESSSSWLSSWSHRKKITISNTNVGSNLTNFPLLVKFTSSSDFGSALATGYDIRFTSSDGKTLLPYEREYWSGGGGSAATGVFWVKVPTVYSATTTDIYVYWGKSGATDGQSATSVWDSNYAGVWHLAETGTNPTVYDSTSNNNDSTAQTWTPTTSGEVGGAGSFNGSSSISIPSASVLHQTGALTLSVWANINSGSSSAGLAGTMGGSDRGHWLALDTTAIYFDVPVSSSTYFRVNRSRTNATSEWHYWTGVYIPSTSTTIYRDGTLDAQNTTSVPSSLYTNTLPFKIGVRSDNTYYFNGLIDEVRISSVARSAAWIKFEYYNMSSSGNELTFGSTE